MASNDSTIKVLKVSDVQEDLNCAICKENAKEKLLSCGHSFCKICLKACKSAGRSIKCGICRQVTNVPGNDLEKLPTDFTSKNMKEKIEFKSLTMRENSEENCGECSEVGKPAVAFCQDCDNAICRQCKDDHSKKIRLRHHVVVDPSERKAKTMQIFLSTIDGKTLAMQVAGPEDSVENLKKTVSDKTGVPVSEMRLICNGRSLDEGNLSDYRIEQHSVVQLVLRLRGGGDL